MTKGLKCVKVPEPGGFGQEKIRAQVLGISADVCNNHINNLIEIKGFVSLSV